MLNVAILEKECRAAGLRFVRHTEFHYVVRGKYEVNVYPTTGRAHLKGGHRSGSVRSEAQVIHLARGEEAVRLETQARRRPMTSQKDLLWRHSHICGLCKDPILSIDEATVDHIIPLARGGSNRFDNLQLAHEHCNSDKGCKL